MMLRYPCREAGESASSYVIRTAHVNGLSTLNVGKEVVAAVADYLRTQPTVESACTPLAVEPLCGSWLLTESSADPVNPAGVSKRFLRCHQRSFCPQCLLDRHYWRASWEYQFVAFCPVHRIWLEDRCSNCNSLVAFWTVPPHCGTCGVRLGSFNQGELIADPKSHLLAEMLARSAESGEWAPDLLDIETPWQLKTPLSYSLLSRIVLLIGSYAGGRDGKPRKVALQSDCRVVRGLISRAAHSLIPWPSAFHQLLKSLQDRKQSSFSGQMSYLYKALYREFNDEEIEFLQYEVEKYLEENWDGVLSRCHRNFSPDLLNNQRMVPAGKVETDTGIPRRELIRGIQEGRIVGSVDELPSGRCRVAIRIGLFDPGDPDLHFLTLNEAAAELGLPERRVRELIGSGVLVGRPPKGGSPWAISKGQLSRLSSDLAGRANTHAQNKGKSLDHVVSYVPAVSQAFPRFISSVLSGEVKIFALAANELPVFMRLRVDTHEIRLWQLAHNGYLSVPHVAELLGLKQEVAYHLYRAGLLVASICDAPYPAFTRDDIKTFQARYVFATELAKGTRCSPKALVTDMTARGVMPASGPGVDGGRQVVYERREIERRRYGPGARGAHITG